MPSWLDTYQGSEITNNGISATYDLLHTAASKAGPALDVGLYGGEGFALLTARVATAGALTVSFQEAAATSTWTTPSPAVSFTAVGATTVLNDTVALPFDRLKRFIRAKAVISGAGAAYDVGVTVVGRKVRL
jgi:hypothetical protein